MSEPVGLSKPPVPDTSADPWGLVKNLACAVTVDIPAPAFKVDDVLRLARQSVVNTLWPLERDVPLRVNGVLIAYGSFEVFKNHLALRVSELA